MLATASSAVASGMLVRSIAKDLFSVDPCQYLTQKLLPILLSETTVVIEEFCGLNKSTLFEAVDIYLGTKVTPKTRRFKVGKNKNEKKMAITIDKHQVITDLFYGASFSWSLVCQKVDAVPHHGHHHSSHNIRDTNSFLKSEVRSYELTFHQKNTEIVLDSYLNYIMKRAEEVKEQDKELKLYTTEFRGWHSTPIDLGHPMTFNTLAMSDEMKQMIKEDLDNFVNGNDFYRRVGKPWKRGYLLYGPPGTGKSSLIAAMANYLNYDIYDLDLTQCDDNSDLRILLLTMPNRTILVLEDIDCSIKLLNREDLEESNKSKKKDPDTKVTLSGLLNFIDGLWSCCGEERIIVFTTNHKEKLDPALLRPGRMDMHIHMSYCTYSAFQQLAFNYLEVFDHELFGEIKNLLVEANATPAEVAGELLRIPDRELCLRGLVDFLNKKIEASKKVKLDGGADQPQDKKAGEDNENEKQDGDDDDDDESEKSDDENEKTDESSDKSQKTEESHKESEKTDESTDESQKEIEKTEEEWHDCIRDFIDNEEH